MVYVNGFATATGPPQSPCSVSWSGLTSAPAEIVRFEPSRNGLTCLDGRWGVLIWRRRLNTAEKGARTSEMH